MGNVDSSNAFAGVDELKETLTGLESRLASIEAGHRHALRVAELDASNQDVGGGLRPSEASGGGGGLAVAGASLACDRSVKVLVGPVVGLVTGDAARVLLEVDRAAEVTAHVCLVDESCPAGRQVAAVKLALPARQPQCFQLSRLLPGERYIVCFSGVQRADAVKCVADFRTIDLSAQEVRWLAVAGDRPDALTAGEFNLWETIAERVQSAHLPPIACVIHAGGNVYLKQAFEDAWVLLKRSAELAERGHLDPGHWRALCAACLDTLRSAYRFAWTLPFTRAALAAAPHLMLGGDADVYPNFSGCAALTAEAGGLAAGTVLRLARRVYWEYQRQLWDPNALAMCAADAAASDATSLVLDAHLVRGARETAVASAESAALELRSAKANAKVLEAAEQVLQTRRNDLLEAIASEQNALARDAKAAQFASPDGVASGLESAVVMVTGHAAVLLVDTKFSALGVGGSPLPAADAASQVFLPQAFWALLAATLEQDSPVRALTVVSAAPIADGARAATRAAAAAGGPFAAEHAQWSARESDQERLLAWLFDWKAQEPYRELLFVSGAFSGGCAATGLVRDDAWPANGVAGGGRARQLVVGPVTDRAGGWPFAPLEGSLGPRSRFAVRHVPLTGQRAYAEALFKVPVPRGSRTAAAATQGGSSSGGSTCVARVAAAKVIGHYFEEVNVVVGPVIGLVTDHSAIVLVEVDAASPVAAVLVDSLTGGERRLLRRLPANKPFVFTFEGLAPARHYVLRFEGVENAASRLGGFTTLRRWAAAAGSGGGDDPKAFQFVALAVHGDEPFAALRHATGEETPPGDDGDDGSGTAGSSSSSGGSPGLGVWSALLREAERPFGAPDVVVHLGGQVDMSAVLDQAAALLARAAAEAAGSLEQRRLDAAARDCLRAAYRTHWNLPGTREALAQGGRLMLRGAADVGALLLGHSRALPAAAESHRSSSSSGGGEGEGGGGEGEDGGGEGGGGEALTGSARRKLCALAEAVYRDYQRALWDPSSGPQDAPIGCSGGAGHGEWHYHRFGCVGVFLMDLKEQRLGSVGGPPLEVPLVAAAQWRSLNSVLAGAKASGLAHLVVCSEVPFVEDCAEDAALKAGSAQHAHLAHAWPCHGGELRKLLHALFGWRAEQPGREVTLLCGGAGFSLRSALRHATRGELLQVVCAPVSAAPAGFGSEPRGRIDDALSYAHGVAVPSRGLMLLEVRRARDAIECVDTWVSERDCETGGASAAIAAGSGGDAALALAALSTGGGGRSSSGWAARPLCLVAALERPEWLELAVARCAATPPPPLLRPRLQTLAALLGQAATQATLAHVFRGRLRSGAHPAAVDPGSWAAVAAPPLLVWFYRDAPDALRGVCAGPPSALALEACARRWNDPDASSSSSGSRSFGKALDSAKPLLQGPSTKLALMDASAFGGLVTEALALGVLLADKLKGGGAGTGSE